MLSADCYNQLKTVISIWNTVKIVNIVYTVQVIVHEKTYYFFLKGGGMLWFREHFGLLLMCNV